MSKAESLPKPTALPQWVPAKVVNYLRHTEEGQSLRDVARKAGINASTVMRQVRHYESRRDDPLMDEALRNLAIRHRRETSAKERRHCLAEQSIPLEGNRILTKLAEAGAVMVLAPDMKKAIILRELVSGKSLRTAVFAREVAQALILKDWISCKKSGKLALYEITPAGRAVAQQLDGALQDRASLANPPESEEGSQELWLNSSMVAERPKPRRVRLHPSESPLQVLARRRDKEGRAFLSSELLRAADYLREDFELAQMGPSLGPHWDRLLSTENQPDLLGNAPSEAAQRAGERVYAALNLLGAELSAIVIRVCCYEEGVELAERRMGWAARSGKIVLRIALQRLRRHYEETYGGSGPLVG